MRFWVEDWFVSTRGGVKNTVLYCVLTWGRVVGSFGRYHLTLSSRLQASTKQSQYNCRILSISYFDLKAASAVTVDTFPVWTPDRLYVLGAGDFSLVFVSNVCACLTAIGNLKLLLTPALLKSIRFSTGRGLYVAGPKSCFRADLNLQDWNTVQCVNIS